jgi:thymidylate kinase
LVFIFDGVDLSGKTTLAEEFSKAKGIPIIKKKLEIFKDFNRTFLQGDNIEAITKFFFESIAPLGEKYDFIIDRSLLSSIVYSKFFNRKFDFSYVYDYLIGPKSFNVTLFHVTLDDASLKRRYQSRGEKFFSVEDLIQIRNLYCKTVEVLKEKGAQIQTIDNSDKKE